MASGSVAFWSSSSAAESSKRRRLSRRRISSVITLRCTRKSQGTTRSGSVRVSAFWMARAAAVWSMSSTSSDGTRALTNAPSLPWSARSAAAITSALVACLTGSMSSIVAHFVAFGQPQTGSHAHASPQVQVSPQQQWLSVAVFFSQVQEGGQFLQGHLGASLMTISLGVRLHGSSVLTLADARQDPILTPNPKKPSERLFLEQKRAHEHATRVWPVFRNSPPA